MEFKEIYLAINEIYHGQGQKTEPVLKPVNAVVTAYEEVDKITGKPKWFAQWKYNEKKDSKGGRFSHHSSWYFLSILPCIAWSFIFGLIYRLERIHSDVVTGRE